MLQKRLQRLETLSSTNPALEAVCRFYSQLYRLFAEAASFLEVEVDTQAAPARQEQGFPLVSAEMLKIDPTAAQTFFARLLQVLQEHGQKGQEELERLSAALQADNLDLPLLLRAAFARDRHPLSAAADTLEVQPALLEYCLTTSLSAALERCRESGLQSAIKEWNHGYCPVCGGLPSIAELSGEEGKKHLQCSSCGNRWGFTRLTCIHCGNTDSETLAYFTAEGEKGCRVDICRKCSGYLKVVDSRERGEGLPLEVEDVATLQLDLLAAQEGFSRGKKETLEP